MRNHRSGLVVLLRRSHLHWLLSWYELLLSRNHLDRLLIDRLLSKLLHWSHRLLDVSLWRSRLILLRLDLRFHNRLRLSNNLRTLS